MTRKIVVCISIIFALTASISFAADSAKEKAAGMAADKWLALVDNGRYADSWTEAAEYFRSAVNQTHWEQSVQSVRKPLGKVISRKIRTRTYTTTLPGAPDGEYVVVQYETSFQNKKSAIETVTPMLDKDGRWRVSGYYIR